VNTITSNTSAVVVSSKHGARRPAYFTPVPKKGVRCDQCNGPVVLRQTPHTDKSMNWQSTISFKWPASRGGSEPARDFARGSRAYGRAHGFVELFCRGDGVVRCSPQILARPSRRMLRYRAVVTRLELSRPCTPKHCLLLSLWSDGVRMSSAINIVVRSERQQ
jgi:hypothetical protein